MLSTVSLNRLSLTCIYTFVKSDFKGILCYEENVVHMKITSYLPFLCLLILACDDSENETTITEYEGVSAVFSWKELNQGIMMMLYLQFISRIRGKSSGVMIQYSFPTTTQMFNLQSKSKSLSP